MNTKWICLCHMLSSRPLQHPFLEQVGRCSHKVWRPITSTSNPLTLMAVGWDHTSCIWLWLMKIVIANAKMGSNILKKGLFFVYIPAHRPLQSLNLERCPHFEHSVQSHRNTCLLVPLCAYFNFLGNQLQSHWHVQLGYLMLICR